MENQPSISSDLIRGHIDTIILRSILEDDKFAQQISDYVESKTNDEYKINQATLYSSLKRLEKLKLVDTYWHDIGDGRRKFFKITDSGRKIVEDNLSSWSYSRTIIDKLMDISPTYVSYKSAETDDNVVNHQAASENLNKAENDDVVNETIETDHNETCIKNDESIDEEKVDVKENVDEKYVSVVSETSYNNDILTEDKSQIDQKEEQEKNFRNILNGLMSLSVSSTLESNENSSEKLMPIANKEFISNNSDVDDENGEKQGVLKFNKTLDETDYNANKSNFNGKTDYGDLSLKAAKEGYVLRISAKDSAKPKGNLLINKINFIAFLFVSLICFIETAVIFLVTGKETFSFLPTVLFAALPIIPLLIFSGIFVFSPQRSVRRKISADSISTAAIIVFNVILAVFVVIFIFNLDLTVKGVLISYLIYPIIYSLDVVLFFLLRFVLRNKKSFNCK